MAAREYEFYLRVLKDTLSARKDKIRIPKRPYNVLFILWILMKFLNKTELFFSANLSECSSSSEKVSM